MTNFLGIQIKVMGDLYCVQCRASLFHLAFIQIDFQRTG